MKTTIELAREAAGDDWKLFQEFMPEIHKLAELVRADERESRAHSLSPGEMELSLRRNYKDELFECRRRFSVEEVMHGPDFMVEATASNLEVEMDRAIQEWSNT